MEKQQSVDDLYEKKGVYGDEIKFEHSSHRLRTVISLIKALTPPPGRILDLGGGTGLLAKTIHDMYPDAEVHCNDISNNAIEIGKKNYTQIHFVVADSEKPQPYKDNYFDLVISADAIGHLKDNDMYASEIARILKPGGTMLLTALNLTSWLNRVLLLMGKGPYFMEPSYKEPFPIFSIGGKTFPDPDLSPSGNMRLYTVDMLERLFGLYGITITERYGISALENKIIKPFDMLMTKLPTFASGYILIGKKKQC